MALDLTKPVQTCDGRAVTILTTTAKQSCPVIGLIHEEGQDRVSAWTEAGCHQHHPLKGLNLVNAPETVKRYLPVYDDGSAGDLSNGALKKGYATPRESVAETDPTARYILELVYLGKRLGSVSIIRRGEVTP